MEKTSKVKNAVNILLLTTKIANRISYSFEKLISLKDNVKLRFIPKT